MSAWNTIPAVKINVQSINSFRASLTNSFLIYQCKLNFACVLICMYASYFVFDVLLYCHITYCLYNIVSGYSVLLLLKIDDDDDDDDDDDRRLRPVHDMVLLGKTTGLGFVQRRWKWHHLIHRIRVPIRLP